VPWLVDAVFYALWDATEGGWRFWAAMTVMTIHAVWLSRWIQRWMRAEA